MKIHRKHLLITLALIILGLAVGGGYWYTARHNSSSPGTNPTNGINYAPPTAQDKSYSQQQKSSHANGSSTGTSVNESYKTPVSPFITTASPVTPRDGYVYINGGVQGVTESGGTCVLKMEKGGKTATATHPGEISGTNTTCGQMSIPYGSGPNSVDSGNWQVSLTYSSSDSAGTYGPINLNITQ